jgi:hypothetical protein
MKALSFFLGLTAVALSLAAQTSDLQSWTASDGRIIQAKFIKLDGESVVIEKDGTSFAVPFAKLNADSVALAKKLGGFSPLAPAPSAASAAAASSSIAPASFLGKTFAQCEAMLGKPTQVQDPEGDARAYTREYKPAIPGLSRIKLQRVPEGSMQGPVPEGMNMLLYYFPKGTIKNLGEAFDKIGLSKEGAKISVSFSTYKLSKEEADGVRKKASEMQKTATMSAALDEKLGRSVRELAGGLEADWTSADASKTRPPEYQHPEEDVLQVREKFETVFQRLNNLTLADSAELRQKGAFGFPQRSARNLSGQIAARFSAWSNAEWLYIQVVVWADGDDAPTKTADGKERGDQTWLLLDLNADQAPDGDRTYVLDPEPSKRGLYRRKKVADKQYDMVADSKGRGGIRFVNADNGKKVRVDSFLIPLAELEKKPGEKIRLAVSGYSPQPDVAFNSAQLTTDGKAKFYIGMPKTTYLDFTLGQQTGTVDPALVPDGRGK